MADFQQGLLFKDELDARHDQTSTPAGVWDQNAAKRALDELFSLTFQYKFSKAYYDLLQFVANFCFYSPFNAMLVHIQMPGARFVASPHRWLRDYDRRIKPGARPLVILQPMGPVMFVFDVSETEGKSLPPEVLGPFNPRRGKIGDELIKSIENSRRDGVVVHTARLGSQQGGSIRIAKSLGKTIIFNEAPVYVSYELEIDQDAPKESRYTSLVHELGHLYCGHLGTPNNRWWPDRRGLSHNVQEIEAESVAYMVCARLGIDNPSERYLAGYVGKQEQVPRISLECVMKTAGLIERMGREKLKPRKNNKR
jgi:hypothetical protein